MVKRKGTEAFVRRVMGARIEGPTRRGWRKSSGLVEVMEKRMRDAGLTEEDLWTRSRWSSATVREVVESEEDDRPETQQEERKNAEGQPREHCLPLAVGECDGPSSGP